jgi:hypothetical protein
MLHLHARLQLCEARDRAVERDNLAIRYERSGFLLMYRFDHLGISGVRDHGEKRGSAPHPISAQTTILSRKDFIRERRQHGRNPFRLGSVSKPGLGISRQSVERVAPGHRISPVNRRVKASEFAQMSAGWASKKTTSQHFLRLTRKDPIV